MRFRLLLGVAAVLIATAAGGCGSSARSASGTPATLPASAVPYLPSVHKPLRAGLLAREDEAPGLAGKLDAWGFQAGAERYFQGESHRLQVVDSRTLRFHDASGAAAYVGFMRSHLGPYLGTFPKLRSIRGGIVATGQECQCHLANPALLAMITRGRIVTWLEINGPGATQRRLVELIYRAQQHD